MESILDLALTTEQETEKIDFKTSLDVHSKGEWCEILKDIIAMANSGGGALVIGITDDGNHSGFDVKPILEFDPAKITDKIFGYTGKHFSSFKITKAQRQSQIVAVIEIECAPIPLVFISPGNYQGIDGKQKNAFNVGVAYFRHGAKSEPGTSDDLAKFLEREISNVKESWLKGIRQVVEAPEGSQVVILAPGASTSGDETIQHVRIGNEDSDPIVNIREEDIFKNYPYDYKKLTKVLKERYTDFFVNQQYHQIGKDLEGNKVFCIKRLLNPNSSKSAWIILFSRAIIFEFAKSAFGNYMLELRHELRN